MVERAIAKAVAAELADDLDALRSELAELRHAVGSAPQAEALMTRQATATWAGCSVRTIDAWLAEGCPHVRLGGPGGSPRFRASELVPWLRSRSTEAPA